MSITLAASTQAGVYKIGNYDAGELLRTTYFYDALHDLREQDCVIYACFDVYGSELDRDIFDKINVEYGVR